MPTRILLVDDDPKLVPLLVRGLVHDGFEVQAVADGPSALEAAKRERPHLVLLDIAMPGPDGLEVCRAMRLEHQIPIIMLTARDDVLDKVSALDQGADDYVVKPFAFDELVARIRAVLRRHQAGDETIAYAGLKANPLTREVTRNGHSVDLTAREFEILRLFLQHPRQVFTREQILERVWGGDSELDANVVEVHIAHLRQKLDQADGGRLIHTIRGIGYALRAAAN
jgi:two-component system, OmpR family, response regulator MprA